MLDYHMHVENYYPFSLDTILRFIDVSTERGVSEIAITEHIYHFVQARDIVEKEWTQDKCFYDLDAYVALLLDAQRQGLPVKVGIEMDYLEGKERAIERIVTGYPWDFVLGSVHWIGDWGFDLKEHREQWDRHDVNQTYREYFRLLGLAVQTGFFDSMSHPDVIKVFGYLPTVDMTDIYEELADLVAGQPGLCVEISSAGLRKPVGRLYPERPLLEAFARRGIAITTASDAHYAEDIGRDFDKVAELARTCGYTKEMAFTRRQAKPVAFTR